MNVGASLHGTKCLVNGRIQAEKGKDLGNPSNLPNTPLGEPVPVSGTAPEGGILGAKDSLVYPAYGHNPLKHWAESPKIPCGNSLGMGAYTPDKITIHAHGFSVKCARLSDGKEPEHLLDSERGKIEGFSDAAARRLRQFMLTNWGGADSYPVAVTLTTHNIYTPEQWNSAIKRFRTYLSRDLPKWAACWRVELQKRKTPHLHCVFWMDQPLPVGVVKVCLTQMWLKAIREEDSNAAWIYSVSVKDLTGESAWVIYCTLHDSKHKKAQLGWKGKQWGLWNRKAWVPRPALAEGEFSHRQRVLLCRRLRSWSRGRFKGKRVKPLRMFKADRNISAFCMDARVTGQLLRGLE